MKHTVRIETGAGDFLAELSERGLARLEFPTSPPRQGTPRTPAEPPAWLGKWERATAVALRAVLRGRRPRALPPLDWSGATDFQRRVWSALLKIPPGRTRSYSELAAATGRPRAARAAGSACGANPIPVLVPCHRVLAADGSLGGFGGGLPWKRRLLALEGVKH